jgi:hypothetical protein
MPQKGFSFAAVKRIYAITFPEGKRASREVEGGLETGIADFSGICAVSFESGAVRIRSGQRLFRGAPAR